MQPKQRQDALVHMLAQHGFLSVRDLAQRLDVSDMTIRRDMRVLEARHVVEVVHGGGQIRGAGQELAFTAKRLLQQDEKAAIARVAWSLVTPGMVVSFSAGTTTWMMARQMPSIFADCTFVTNSTNVALELSQQGAREIILTGGNFRTPSDALVGPIAESAVRRLKMDMLFLGVHGVDRSGGISTPNLLEAAIDQALMERATKVVVLFDHCKWGIEALGQIASVRDAHVCITDGGSAREDIEQLRGCGVQVLVATVESSGGA